VTSSAWPSHHPGSQEEGTRGLDKKRAHWPPPWARSAAQGAVRGRRTAGSSARRRRSPGRGASGHSAKTRDRPWRPALLPHPPPLSLLRYPNVRDPRPQALPPGASPECPFPVDKPTCLVFPASGPRYARQSSWSAWPVEPLSDHHLGRLVVRSRSAPPAWASPAGAHTYRRLEAHGSAPGPRGSSTFVFVVRFAPPTHPPRRDHHRRALQRVIAFSRPPSGSSAPAGRRTGSGLLANRSAVSSPEAFGVQAVDLRRRRPPRLSRTRNVREAGPASTAWSRNSTVCAAQVKGRDQQGSRPG